MSEWQPIETAPIEAFKKDDWFMAHSESLLLWDGWPRIGTYNFTKNGKGRWKTDDGRVCNPSWWMPLPSPPGEGK